MLYTVRKSPYSIQIRENTDQKSSEYRHFLCSAIFPKIIPLRLFVTNLNMPRAMKSTRCITKLEQCNMSLVSNILFGNEKVVSLLATKVKFVFGSEINWGTLDLLYYTIETVTYYCAWQINFYLGEVSWLSIKRGSVLKFLKHIAGVSASFRNIKWSSKQGVGE